eukprot:s1401_g18.t2
MGACCTLGADPVSDSTMSPAAAEVQLKTGEVQRVSLVPASHCYCLLIAPGSALFMDVRSRDLFDRNHVFGAWSVGTLSKAGNHGAIRSRCDLRWLVLMGSHEDPLKDERVLELLELLHDLQVRPISQRPLLLLGGVGEFQRRFPFCMRTAGKEQLEPLPACPAEVIEPGQASVVKGAKASRNRSLYLGSLACLTAKNSEASRALKIAAAVRIIEESTDPDPEHGPLLPGLNVCEVHMPSSAPVRSLDVEGKAGVADDKSSSSFDRTARAVAYVAVEASGRALSMGAPCLLCGPWSAVAAALYVSRLKPTWTGDELIAFIKERCPGTWSHLAQEALHLGLEASQSPRSPHRRGLQSKAPLEATRAEVEQLQQQLAQRLRLHPEEASRSLRTVRVALDKISTQPHEEKFRRLKASNDRVVRELLSHSEAVALLERASELVLPKTPLPAIWCSLRRPHLRPCGEFSWHFSPKAPSRICSEK